MVKVASDKAIQLERNPFKCVGIHGVGAANASGDTPWARGSLALAPARMRGGGRPGSGAALPKDSESALVQLAIAALGDAGVDEFGAWKRGRPLPTLPTRAAH